MKPTKFSKAIAMLLCIVMTVSLLPVTAMAANTSFTNTDLTVASEKKSTLAPGVTLNQMVVFDQNTDRVELCVTTIDTSVDTVKVFAGYKNMDPTKLGFASVGDQIEAFYEKAAAGDEYYQGKVVAGINASYFNTATGQSDGAFVMNGVDVTTDDDRGNGRAYFAVMKDGTYKIGMPGDYSTDKANILEAIGIHYMLVVNGEVCSGLENEKHPYKYARQTIGLTADGKIILVTADKNGSSVGLTNEEQAQAMLDLGCVWAGHLDGGNSTTMNFKRLEAKTNKWKYVKVNCPEIERFLSDIIYFATLVK